ncbi:MAG: NEW3 domain-containing protein [Planctomycetota bacterium]
MLRFELAGRLAGALSVGLLSVATLRGEDPPAPWSASTSGGESDVADWANKRFAPATKPSKSTAAEPSEFAFVPPAEAAFQATPAPSAGDRYASTSISVASPERPKAKPLAAGNPLRGSSEPKVALRSSFNPARTSAAEAAFAQRSQTPSESAPPAAPRRISIGADPVTPLTKSAGEEPSVAIAPEAFAEPAPLPEPEPQPITPPAEPSLAWQEEAEQPTRIAAASAYEPQPLPTELSRSFQASATRDAQGLGRPGPEKLEGPQEASLVIEKRGPREARIGQSCRFAIKVRNTGTGPAHNVVLSDETPAGTRLVTTSPSASQQDGKLVWRLGTLASGAERVVEMRLEPLREGPIGSVATVTMDASASASTNCTRPQIALRMAAPDSVLLGEEQVVSIEVHNPGTGSATNVMLVEDVPPQLRHPAGAKLEFEVGTLAAGETRRINLRLTAEQAGRVTNTVAIIADGDLRAERSVEFDVIAPSLAVSIDGPSRRYLERPASYTIGVDNPGTAPAKDVRLVTHLPRGMKFVRANNLGEYDSTTHSVYWSLAELPEGERGEVELTAMPLAAGDHTLRVEGESADGLEAEENHRVRVEGVAALAFEVRDLQDPIEIGDETVYEIRVLNEGSKAASGVRVRVEAPSGMRVVAAQGQSAHRLEAGRAEFAPLPQLAPGEKAAYRVRIAGVEAGDQRVTVLVESDELSRPIRREESTRVFGDE